MSKTNILALASTPAMRLAKSQLGGAIIVILLAVGLAASATAQSRITQVVGGLHSPRGLAFGPGGQLFVAQSGDETVDGSIIEILSPMAVRPRVRTIVSGLPVRWRRGRVFRRRWNLGVWQRPKFWPLRHNGS